MDHGRALSQVTACRGGAGADETERERLLGKLELGQKARLLSGAAVWRTREEPVIAEVATENALPLRGRGR